jgi:3-oxoacyl-[acyl-carrier protein] reductase
LRIQGSSVLVTGGCGGIGRAIGERFAREGLQVLLADRDIAPAEELARKYPGIRLLAVDLGDPGEVERHLKPFVDRDELPDILVNGVGISPKSQSPGKAYTTWEMPIEQWLRVMDVNLNAYFYCSRIVLPRMIRRRSGRIVNIASLAARTGGHVAPSHYVATKAGVLGLTKIMAKEAGAYGVTVNAINPGRIDTPMIHDVSDEVNEAYKARIPLGRLGVPDDVASVVLYLASDLADYLTGTTIEVNGGLYMGP